VELGRRRIVANPPKFHKRKGRRNKMNKINELLKEVECRLVMPWAGTIIENSFTAEQIHRKITDDLRTQFNQIDDKWREE